jgi:Zn-dependent peptidase ImmA (M78 family)
MPLALFLSALAHEVGHLLLGDDELAAQGFAARANPMIAKRLGR